MPGMDYGAPDRKKRKYPQCQYVLPKRPRNRLGSLKRFFEYVDKKERIK